MKDRYFLYISSAFSNTVIESQVVNWIKLLANEGIQFDVLFLSYFRAYLKFRSFQVGAIKSIRADLNGEVYSALLTSPKDRTSVSDILVFITLVRILFASIFRGKRVFIQTRDTSALRAIKWIKKFYGKIEVVYDARGAVAEEYLLKNKLSSIEKNVKKGIKKNYYDLLKKQLGMAEISKKTICVSRKLKEYLVERSPVIENRIVVVPGTADGSQFFFDEKKRKAVRTGLKVDDRIVLVYAGRLNLAWQIPEFMFAMVNELNRMYKDIFFMCLTPDTGNVERMVSKLRIDQRSIFFAYIPYSRINDYLSAADIGVLLRENNLTNRVASPTKFAEYVLSGLPIIISEGIGDFSDFVKENEIGLVTRNNIEEIVHTFKEIFIQRKYDRNKISRLGLENFSKQRFMAEVKSIYN